MPHIRVNGANIHYIDEGSGPETIVFAHGLLWSQLMFRDQIDALKGRYRCIAYDHRGQGQTEVTDNGYDMDTLAADAIALIEALDVAPCHFVGLSMGGFVGQRVALRRPDLLRSLTLLESSAEPEPQENVGRYKLLNFVARWIGLGLVANQVMPIMFGQTFLNDPERAALREECKQRMIGNHRIGITRAVAGVVARKGVLEQLDQIQLPTLIVVGEEDVATKPPKSERMHARIPNSQLVTLPRAGHTSTIEEPAAVNDVLQRFLAAQSTEAAG